eukprot:gb/GECG01005695.1/.p1 GENE.gb/GECG01005695.1/~~gb/GECG01005695.1/.p1  ORF type:complete len:606 (+),score=92.44 gb/GECG01005695.1/:1-1818(+)
MYHIRITNASPFSSEEVLGRTEDIASNASNEVLNGISNTTSTSEDYTTTVSEAACSSVPSAAAAASGSTDITTTTASTRHDTEPELHEFTCGSTTEMICGKLRFFRSPGPVLEQQNSRTLAVLAVPIRLSARDFLNFCGHHIQYIEHLRFLKDTEPSWYSVVLRFCDKNSAWKFYNYQNGRQFTSLGTEVCFVVQVSSILVEDSQSGTFTLDAEGFLKHGNVGTTNTSSGPNEEEESVDDTRELPTCPVCLERLDASVSGLITTMCNHSFHRLCLSKWKDSSCPVCRYVMDDGESNRPLCEVCEAQDVWMCIVCGHVGCGRYNRMHAVQHFRESGHAYAMELATQRVWDYAGDGYVHRLIQNKTDGKIVELPDPNSAVYCAHCGKPTYVTQSSQNDTSGAAGTGGNGLARSHQGPATDVTQDDASLFKMDALSAEYNALLTSQLEVQRDYYEKKIAEVEKNRDLETVSKLEEAQEENIRLKEETESLRKSLRQSQSKVKQLQQSVKSYTEELDFLREINSSLEKNQKHWEKQLQTIKQDAASRQKQKDEEIADLKEQVRDLMFSLEAQNKVEATNEELREDIKGGSVHIAEGTTSNSKGRSRRKR